MADVSVYKDISFSLEDSEFEILNQAYNIVKEIEHDLWINDNDETELFDYSYSAKANLKALIELSGRKIIIDR